MIRLWPFGRREKRAVSFHDFWGSGADVTGVRANSTDVALTLVPVFAATRLLADSIASLPLQTFRTVGAAREQVPTGALLQDPTEFGTVYDWIHRAVTSLTLRGNAFGYVTSWDSDANPARIEWLNPDEVTVGDNRAVARPSWYWQGRPVDSGRLIHIPGFTLPGLVLGLSPIAAYATTIETGLYAQMFGRDWFVNGSVPASVLETEHEIDEEQAKIIKARFRAAASGREPVTLGAGVQYKPIAVPPNESQFLATMKATVTQVASIYGIPPEMIGGETGASMTYANVEQQAINFVSYTLRPHLVKLETALSRLLPPAQYAKFNVDAIIRADLKTRYEAHHLALSDGWKSKDEVRALEDLAPLPGGQGEGFAPMLGANPPPPAPKVEPVLPPKPVQRDDSRLRVIPDD